MSSTHPQFRRIAASVTTLAAVAALTTACTGAEPTKSSSAPTPEASSASAASKAPRPSTWSTSSSQTCAGKGIDHSAAITASHEILIDAPLKDVWDTQMDVARWSDWQDAVTTIRRLDSGAFDASSKFRWRTPIPASKFAPADTLTITSSVQALEPEHCVLWEGPAIGKRVSIEMGTHLWTFTETPKGTLVHTEESWDADVLTALKGKDADAAKQMLGGGLVVWLKALKTEAEAKA